MSKDTECDQKFSWVDKMTQFLKRKESSCTICKLLVTKFIMKWSNGLKQFKRQLHQVSCILWICGATLSFLHREILHIGHGNFFFSWTESLCLLKWTFLLKTFLHFSHFGGGGLGFWSFLLCAFRWATLSLFLFFKAGIAHVLTHYVCSLPFSCCPLFALVCFFPYLSLCILFAFVFY